jgi:hypothetical protein
LSHVDFEPVKQPALYAGQDYKVKSSLAKGQAVGLLKMFAQTKKPQLFDDCGFYKFKLRRNDYAIHSLS